MIKINLGSHNKKIGEDFINIDVLQLENVDAICNINKLPFQLDIKNTEKFDPEEWDLFEGENIKVIPNNIVDEIVMEEVLEHISFRNTVPLLKEIYRILKPGGKIHIQVPDCGKSMEYYANDEVCECVAHKPKTENDAKAKPNCPKCKGKGKIHPNRWLFSFLGAQKHQYDMHLNIFNEKSLEINLKEALFEKIEFNEDPLGWKLKVNCYK